jgi:hypothetical protein
MRIKKVVLLVGVILSSSVQANMQGVEEIDGYGDMSYSYSESSMIPTNLPWPVYNKDIRDTSIFFDTDDAVEAVHRTCSSRTRFPKHLGVDIETDAGTEVMAVHPGHVVRTGYEPKWGHYVVLSHDNNTWTSVYWHLKGVTVKADDRNGAHFNGDDVVKGEILGYVFDTSPVGDVPHLHFGLRPVSYHWKYNTNGVKGIGDCSNNQYGFVDPYEHLSNEGYALLDDTDATHTGTWKSSTATDMYTGKGYKALTDGKLGSATYEYKVPSAGRYYLYTRFTPSGNRTSDAVYKIYINDRLYKTVNIDQSRSSYRAQNVYLAAFKVSSSNTKFKIEMSNGAGADVLISDALLVKRRN